MNFKNLSHRASWNSIFTFVKDDCQNFYDFPEEAYAQRIATAQKNATEFFRKRYTDMDEFDEIYGYFDEQTAVYEEVYFEMGLILGAKIAFEINEKAEKILG